MTTIDLGAQHPARERVPEPADTLDAMPRRVALTLPELRLAAERASGAPLPFDLTAPRGQTALDDRLGVSRGSVEDQAYAAALAALHDPVDSLTRRGLLDDGRLDAGLAGAMGLLALPTHALEIDVAVPGTRLHCWHRRSGDAVACLATVDGLVFELAWLRVEAWSGELARVAVLPEELALHTSGLSDDRVLLPFDLLTAAAEAQKAGRFDLLPVLAGRHEVTAGEGRVVPTAEVVTALQAITGEAQGRLRAMAAEVSATEAGPTVGVVSWTLLADGWRALRPHQRGAEMWVEVARVEPAALAAELAPVLAEVMQGVSA